MFEILLSDLNSTPAGEEPIDVDVTLKALNPGALNPGGGRDNHGRQNSAKSDTLDCGVVVV